MKTNWLVIAYHHDAVKLALILVLTARHGRKIRVA
jgi:hypothetical protein